LYRAILSSDGRAVLPEANPPFLMTSDGGLDVTQGPSGELYTAKYKGGKVRVLMPIEPSSDALSLKSVFPRRGHVSGGTTLHVYGKNFDLYGVPLVQVGDAICSLASLSPSRATCILPPGSGRVDVSMFAGNATSVLEAGYRFITGAPISTESPLQAPSTNPSSVPIFPSVAPMTAFTPFAFRLNAGGGYYADKLGQLWQPDAFHNFFKGPSRIALTEHDILETDDKPLFQSARSFRRNQPGPYLYDIPVPVPGIYRINLGFAEMVEWRTEIGDRLVNVTIENVPVVDNFDVVKEAGAAYTAIMTSHRVVVLDGAVTLQFTPVKFDPMISAIEIVLEDRDPSGVDMAAHTISPSPAALPAPSLNPLTAISRLNAGGKAYVDLKGISWEADLHYYGGSGASQTNHSIANTNDEHIFQSARFFRRNRQGPFFYEIPVPLATNYTVVLGFAEIVDWRTEAGDRRMSIAIEDDTVLDSFDIVEAAGAAYTAMYKTFRTSVHDGNLTIVFTPSKYNPTVSTIEVFLGTL
jgi:Malectin domain/IPT/TIG domain